MKKRMLIGLSTLVVLLILFAPPFLLLPSWIRATLVPHYVNLFYSHGVSQTFNNNYSSLNADLSAYRITFKNNSVTCYNHVTDNGQNGYYHDLRETVPCQRSESSTPLKLTSTQTANIKHLLNQLNWKTIEPNFIVQAQNGGWSAAYDVDITFGYKVLGKTYCIIGQSLPIYYPNNSYHIVEACERDVSFFGGDGG